MALTSSAATPFVGRESELAALVEALEPGSGEVVRVSGEAGVGKSRLVLEAVARSGSRALIGISSPGSLGRPFDLVLSAIEPAVRNWTGVPGRLTAVRGALSHLLSGVAPGLDIEPKHDRVPPTELISAGIALLRHLDPELLVLEDLQWADVESLQVIERLLAGPEHPVIVATYRSEDLDGRGSAAELLAALGARRGSQHLHLEPFGSREIRSLLTHRLGRTPSPTVVDRLRSRTGGNAFFLEEVLASADGWDQPRSVLDDLPATLAETIRLRVKSLSEEERDTLATAAVLGSPFEFDLLATALDTDEADLIDRLRPLIDRRLVVEPEVDVFRFRHELVRESVLVSLLGRERRRLHERALTATQRHRPDAYAELARHAAGSGRLDELALVAPDGVRHYLTRGSTQQALVLAELALTEWPDHVELLELAARSAWLTGRADVACGHATNWKAVADRLTDGEAFEPLAMLARIAYERGDRTTQISIVADMEERLCTLAEPTSRARLLAELAQHHMLMDDSEHAVELAGRAEELAIEHGMDDLVRQIAVERSTAEMVLSSGHDEGLAGLARVAKEAEAAGEFVTAARALHNLSLYQQPDEADRSLDAMRDVAERGGFDLASAVLLPIRKIDVAMARADLHETQVWIDRARTIGAEMKTRKYVALAEALVRLEAGADLDPPMMARLPTTSSETWSVRLRWAARTDDDDAVISLLSEPPTDRFALIALARALSDLSLVDVDADAVTGAAEAVTAAEPDQIGRTMAEALLADWAGDPAADDLLERASRDDDHGRTPDCHLLLAPVVTEAEVLLARSRRATRRGRGDEGRELAGAAADLLTHWPGPRRDRALALAAQPVCSQDLTGREIDVARLVARGMTNGQIAEELFIARKTVSTHVSHILTKLEMTSRTEVATWAVRTGLAPEA